MIFLRTFLEEEDEKFWSTPIGHIVKRDHLFQFWGDASIKAGGGYSPQLKVWWYIEWPSYIKDSTIDKFQCKILDKKSRDLISINILEFVVIIISYAAALVVAKENNLLMQDRYPVGLFLSDNT